MADLSKKNDIELPCKADKNGNSAANNSVCSVREMNPDSGFISESRDELGHIYARLCPGDSAEVVYKEDCAEYHLHNAGGEGRITAYPAFDGVSVLYDDMHLETFGEGTTGKYELIIEHCRQGRFEAGMRDGRRFYIGAGDICLHNMDYGDINVASMPYRHYHGCTVMIKDASDGLFQSFLKGAGVNFDGLVAATRSCRGVRLVGQSEKTARIFEDIYRAGGEERRGILRLRVVELLLVLGRELSEKFNQTRAIHPEVAELIKSIERYIWKNLGGDLSLAELCVRFCISATSLKTYFKIMYGCPIHAYISTCRMQVAAKMLSCGTEKVSEVARAVGYRNGSKFAQSFLKYSGCTPVRWRAERRTADWAFFSPENN